MWFFFVCGFFFLQVSEMAVSELPGNPNAVWTVRRHVEGKRSAHVECVLAHELCKLV